MIDWSTWLGIGIGGALGALSRAACFRASEIFATRFGDASTSDASQRGLLVANTLGCLAIGLLAGKAVPLPEWLFLTLGAGFCASLTTFSTLCAQLVQQLREAEGLRGAAVQLGLNLVLGFAALSLGLAAGQ